MQTKGRIKSTTASSYVLTNTKSTEKNEDLNNCKAECKVKLRKSVNTKLLGKVGALQWTGVDLRADIPGCTVGQGRLGRAKLGHG